MAEDRSARADVVRNRAAILEAAADVLAVSPGASLSEVARRAGLARATLYRHFPSREALLVAIREEALARAAAALADADLADGSARDALRRGVRALVPLGFRFRILLAEGADADPDFMARRDRTLAPLGQVVARGIASGELDRRADPRWVVVVLSGLLMSAVRAAAAGILEPSRAADLVCATLLDGVGGPA